MPAREALNVRMLGTGSDVVVLAHGFGTDQGVWERYLPALTARFRVLLYDLPCAGTADPAYFDLQRHGVLEGHAEDLAEILSGAAVRACSFVGHSVSGMIGILAAIERPDLFRHLITIGASPRYLDAPGYTGGFDTAAVQAMLHAVEARFRVWAQDYTATNIDRPLDDPAAQSFLASILRMRPDIAIGMAKAIFFSDYRAELDRCTVPVTILQTRRDPAVPLQTAEYLRDHLKGSTLEFIETTGHLPHLSAAAQTEAALLRNLP